MWSEEYYQKALIFAANAHQDQKVKGKNYPYIVHVINVCTEVITAIFKSKVKAPDLAIQCSLLHDTIEDTDATYKDIFELFGKNVADGVIALSKDKKLAKNEQIIDSINRIKKQPIEVGLVKLADRIVNLQEPPSHWTLAKIKEYQKDAVLIYENLKRCNKYLAKRLDKKIKDYSKYINT